MKNFRSNRTFGRLAFAALLGVTLVTGFAGTSSVRAADDGEDQELWDVKALRGFLHALGLKRDGDDGGIKYRERSPLVLPTDKNQLPPPETVDPAAKTAGWPDDPDVKERKRRKLAEKNRKPYTEGVDDRPLRPSEMSSVPPKGKTVETPNGSIEQSARPSTAAELGSKDLKKVFGSLFAPKEEYTTFTSEPPRENLTDPPAGYRTPSPNQPYGVGQEKWKPPVIDRQEPVR